MSKTNIAFLLLIFLGLFSCKKDQTYDKKNAVSAFYQVDPLLTSKNIQQIDFEPQKEASQWNFGDNFHQNGRIGNFKKKFSYKKDKITFKKSNILWLDFDLSSNNDDAFLPVIDGDNIYFLDESGILLSFNIKSKKKAWQQRIFKKFFFKDYKITKIFGYKDKIFAISGSNEIVAVAKKDGKILWQNSLPALAISKPIAYNNLVYVATDKNELFALNIDDGKILWSHAGITKNTAIFGAADPVIYGDKIFASYSSGEIYALNKDNGSEIWSFDLNLNKAIGSDFYLNDIDATPIANNGVLYVSGNGGLMMAIEVASGNILWKKQIATVIDFHLAGNFLYIINNDNKLIALNRKTGDIKWLKQLKHYKNDKKPQSKIIYNGVIMAGDKLLIDNSLGNILVISPLDGKIEQEVKIGSKSFYGIIINDDKLYLHRSGWFGRYFTALK